MLKLYTSELTLADEHLDAFVQWYAFRHAPDIYQIGFHTCTSYRAVAGGMGILDLYEIDSVDIFDTPQYRSVSQSDPYFNEVLQHRQEKAHAIHEQVHVLPAPVDARPLLNADWLHVERFELEAGDGEVPAQAEALRAYLDGGEGERILLAGAKRVRLARRTKSGPKHVSDRPRWLLLTEWAAQPTLADIGPRLKSRFGAALSRQSLFTGYRLYPWADRPEVRALYKP